MHQDAQKRNEQQSEDRNWLPVGAAFAVVALLVLIFAVSHRHTVAAGDAAYRAQVRLSHFVMSESSNLAGGKVTYMDGQVTNAGTKTLVSVHVRVAFRNAAGEVSQSETMPLNLIRTREPYIDTEPVAASPLKPGQQRDFRLIFDQVTPDWDGQYPQVIVADAETR